jgi:hypothetical protein
LVFFSGLPAHLHQRGYLELVKGEKKENAM